MGCLIEKQLCEIQKVEATERKKTTAIFKKMYLKFQNNLQENCFVLQAVMLKIYILIVIDK